MRLRSAAPIEISPEAALWIGFYSIEPVLDRARKGRFEGKSSCSITITRRIGRTSNVKAGQQRQLARRTGEATGYFIRCAFFRNERRKPAIVPPFAGARPPDRNSPTRIAYWAWIILVAAAG
jgi:hypothetical protein